MSFSNELSRGLLAGVFSKATGQIFGGFASAPANIFVGLSTTAPAADGTNITEPVGNAYARASTVPGDWTDPTDADPSVIDNSSQIDFATPTGAWGNITHFFLFTTSDNTGVFLGANALTTARNIVADDVVNFQVGELDVTLT